MNQIFLRGFVGDSPTVFYTNNGNTKVSVPLGVKTHEDNPTEWHRIVSFENIVPPDLAKGDLIEVEGVLHYNVFKPRDSKYIVKQAYIRVRELNILSRAKDRKEKEQARDNPKQPSESALIGKYETEVPW